MREDDDRPDPDRLLAAIKREERERTGGKLRIFFGYAAGVGKTFAMLEAAGRKAAEGVDVVVGYVETHGRPETEALLLGLAVIPRKEIPYRGTRLQEMDLDAILQRKPQLVLVDEIAHSNAPGSRHPKRYLDVEELLDAGIDVWTTLNVQHLESMKEAVAQITHIVVAESVPDHVFDLANEIKVVDIAPEELLQRLKEGKVYMPEVAAHALQNFFQSGNLIALRQITLRRVAEHLDEQMRDYMESLAIPGPWPARERLLVCVDPRHQMGERLARAGRRLSDELYAEWEVVLVATPREAGRQWIRDRSRAALSLAEKLGAAVNPTPLVAEAEDIIEYARRNNVTRLIIDWPVRPRWRERLFPTLAVDLIRHSGPIDVVVVTDEKPPPEAHGFPRVGPTAGFGYAQALLFVVAATIVCQLLPPYVQPSTLIVIYFLAVVLVAVTRGLGPAILTSVLSVVTFDYLFIQPRFTIHLFSLSEPQYFVSFAALQIVGVVASVLVSRTRERAETARRREAQTATLYALTRDLASAAGLDQILASLISHIHGSFGSDAVVLLPEKDRLKARSASHGLTLSEDEIAVADWAFKRGQPSGLGTDILPGAKLSYWPMRGATGVIGVLGLLPKSGQGPPTLEEARLLEAVAAQAAQAIERLRRERGMREGGRGVARKG